MLAASVIISTHNPDMGRLQRTLYGLQQQVLERDAWELVLVDNASSRALSDAVLAGISFAARIVREDRLGLTYGRLAGVRHAGAPLVIFLDDDNVLAPDFLQHAIAVMQENERLGLVGGIIEPVWETTHPDPWVSEFFGTLALRDFGPETKIASFAEGLSYPTFAPVGAGMVARKFALASWASAVETVGAARDRTGANLSSAGDCDIVIRALQDGWSVGYAPQLRLGHIIPAGRLAPGYLAELNHGIAKSWVELLLEHGLSPWRRVSSYSVPLRKARAYFGYRAWRNHAAYVRWRGACGHFEGRASQSRHSHADQ